MLTPAQRAKLTPAERARYDHAPWLWAEKRRPTDGDAPPLRPLPGKAPNVDVRQLTLTQATGYDLVA